jgi:hypothetical protein
MAGNVLVVRHFQLLLGAPRGRADFGDPTEVARLQLLGQSWADVTQGKHFVG